MEASVVRIRNRPDFDPRPFFVNADVVKDSNGSAYLEAGNSKILATVHGPLDLKSSDASGQERSSRGRLEVTVRFATFSRETRVARKEFSHSKRQEGTEEEKRLSQLLRETFSPAICLDRYPKTQLEIYITVLEDDGGVLSSSILCTSVALADGGVELYDLVVSLSVMIRHNQILVDPDKKELLSKNDDQDNSDVENATLVYALMPSLNQVSLCYQRGVLSSAKRLDDAVRLAADTCYRLYNSLQTVITNSVKTKLQTNVHNT